jgi:hypothetical protein
LMDTFVGGVFEEERKLEVAEMISSWKYYFIYIALSRYLGFCRSAQTLYCVISKALRRDWFMILTQSRHYRTMRKSTVWLN